MAEYNCTGSPRCDPCTSCSMELAALRSELAAVKAENTRLTKDLDSAVLGLGKSRVDRIAELEAKLQAAQERVGELTDAARRAHDSIEARMFDHECGFNRADRDVINDVLNQLTHDFCKEKIAALTNPKLSEREYGGTLGKCPACGSRWLPLGGCLGKCLDAVPVAKPKPTSAEPCRHCRQFPDSRGHCQRCHKTFACRTTHAGSSTCSGCPNPGNDLCRCGEKAPEAGT